MRPSVGYQYGHVAVLLLLLALTCVGGRARASFAIGNLQALGVERDAGLRYAQGDRGLLDFHSSASDAGRPLVVFFHGGGFTRGSRADYRFAGARSAAERGADPHRVLLAGHSAGAWLGG